MLKCRDVKILILVFGINIGSNVLAMLQNLFPEKLHHEQQAKICQKVLSRRLEAELCEERQNFIYETCDDVDLIEKKIGLRDDIATLLALQKGKLVPHDMLTKCFISSLDPVIIEQILATCDKNFFLLLVNTPFTIYIPFPYETTKLNLAILQGSVELVHIILDRASKLGEEVFVTMITNRIDKQTPFDGAAHGRSFKIFNDFIEHAATLGQKAFFSMIQSDRKLTILRYLRRNKLKWFVTLDKQAAKLGSEAYFQFTRLL